MFTKLISALKATRRTIVFTEGPDARILEAADRLIQMALDAGGSDNVTLIYDPLQNTFTGISLHLS